MRIWVGFVTGLLLAGCRKDRTPPPEEPKVSYSREIRPILARHCIKCHELEGNSTGYLLSLAAPKIPTTFSLPHPEGITIPPKEDGLLLKWRVEGGNVDEHWALGPLEGSDWNPAATSPGTEESFPEGDFREHLRLMIAGDLLPDQGAILKTNWLRQGDDNPTSRLKLVSQFLGFPIDRISAPKGISAPDETRLRHIFSTPHDGDPSNSLEPPTFMETPIHDPDPLWADWEKDPEENAQNWFAQKNTTPQIPGLVAAFSFDNGKSDNVALGHFNPANFELTETTEGVSGLAVAAPRGVILPSSMKFSSIHPFTLSLWVKVDALAGDIPLIVKQKGSRGFYFGLQDGRPTARFIRYWPGNAIYTITEAPTLLPGQWSHLTLSYDGSRKAGGLQLLVNGVSIPQLTEADSLRGRVFPIGESFPTTLGGQGTDGLALDEIQIFDRQLSALEIRTLRDGKSLLNFFKGSKELSPKLTDYFVSTSDSRRRFESALLQHRENKLVTEDQLKETLVMESLPRAEPPTEARLTGPKCLDAIDRLEFVDTLIHTDVNLLARALANNVWKAHFGEALVPGLGNANSDMSRVDDLDALAVKLIDLDWDLARLSAFLTKPVSP